MGLATAGQKGWKYLQIIEWILIYFWDNIGKIHSYFKNIDALCLELWVDLSIDVTTLGAF